MTRGSELTTNVLISFVGLMLILGSVYFFEANGIVIGVGVFLIVVAAYLGIKSLNKEDKGIAVALEEI